MALILKRERWKQEANLFVVGPGIEQEQQFALRFNPLLTMKTQVGNAEEVICTKERQEIQDLLSVREVMPDSHDQRNNVVKSVITVINYRLQQPQR